MKDFFKQIKIEDGDKLAMAEAYRLYETLPIENQNRIPSDFINTLLALGDLKSVKRFETRQEIDDYKFSEKAKYLIMYMCTFN